MIGILFVSHSSRIAEGVLELAAQMVQQQVPMRAAGGMPDGSLGTNAETIRAAADELAKGDVDGVLVLVDLGSAVMSTEVALEDFPHPYMIADAPLVEGAILAAIEASIGASLQDTATAAEQGRDFQKVSG